MLNFEFYKETRRYGVILSDDTVDNETGCYRFLTIESKDKEKFFFVLRNGEVIKQGFAK